MIIINSAAYVIPEFRSEFGKIPPCLLPIGNRKLVEYQVPLLRKAYAERIIVSLPHGYELSIDEVEIFSDLAVEIAYVPDHFSLSEALLFVLNTVGLQNENHEPLRLMHGDTLMDDLPQGVDLIAVSVTEDDYNWESEGVNSNHPLVWCGYFSFSSQSEFVRSLALAQGSFVQAVRIYSERIKLNFKELSGWHDLGHVNTYFVSRSQITTQRVFNSLRIQNGAVWKSGTQQKKIQAESEWFGNLPAKLKRYTPQLIDAGTDASTNAPFYVIEYLPFSPLNEVFVHGRNPDFYWSRIFKLMVNFLGDARSCVATDSTTLEAIKSDAFDLYENKTYTRLEEYSSIASVNMSESNRYGGVVLPSLFEIAEDCIRRTLLLPIVPSVLHGDLCFSNMLFDSRSVSIKVIDPRGINQQQELTIFGDQKYDLAKACHSVVGLYDFIISGRYQIERDESGEKSIRFRADDRLLNIQKLFMEVDFIPGVKVSEIMPLTVLLFLSMLPLHSDRPDRQEAMLVNALRLYAEYVVV